MNTKNNITHNMEEYNLFFYWMNERHRIYLNKEAGKSWPWTKDLILQEYKFTNVYRQLDAVTKEWTERKAKLAGLTHIFWHCAVFRMFNWPNTYDALKEAGLLTYDSWDWKKAAKLLKFSRDRYNNKIFTGAYIITNNGKKDDKIDLCCGALDVLFEDIPMIMRHLSRKECSLESAHVLLSTYPMWGPFTAYELVTDLRWTPLLCDAPDIMTWANPGPGAKRGCNRIFRNGPKDGRGNYLNEMFWLLHESTKRGRLKKYMEPLEMRDIEHSLCEFDKYMRVLNGEGKPRSKYMRREA